MRRHDMLAQYGIKSVSADGPMVICTDALRCHAKEVTISAIQNVGDLVTDGVLAGKYAIPVRVAKTPIRHRLNNASYVQIAYIESTGTQYINTGVMSLITHKLSVTLCGTTQSAKMYNYAGAIYGSGLDITSYSGLNAIGGRFGGQSTGGVVPYEQYRVHTFELWNGGFACDGAIYPLSLSQPIEPKEILLFAAYNDYQDTAPAGCPQRVYGSKIWNGASLIRDFVPCRCLPDGAIGMYDLVSETFFMNQGTGTFIAGNEVAEPIIATIYLDEPLRQGDTLDVVSGKLLKHDQSNPIFVGGQNIPAFNGTTIYEICTTTPPSAVTAKYVVPRSLGD